MRKLILNLTFIFIVLFSFGQHDTTGLKTVKKYQGDKLKLIKYYDINGNCTFSKEDRLDGDGVSIFTSDYDSLKREIRTIYAHSTTGYSIIEKEYEPFIIKTYSYIIDCGRDSIIRDIIISNDSSATVNIPVSKMNPYEIVEKINNKEELENLYEIKKLFHAKHYLESIAYLDKKQNIIKEISFECYGDTSSIYIYKYNNKNKEIYFHNDLKDVGSAYDIYSEYDNKGNNIKWFHVVNNSGMQDTSETYYYKYSNTNKIIEELRYIENEFDYKIIYEYDKKDNRINETFYDTKLNQIKTITSYKYDIKGNVIEEIKFDLTKSKTIPEYIFNTFYEYW